LNLDEFHKLINWEKYANSRKRFWKFQKWITNFNQ
jgi:hypothetical protein